MDDESTVDSRPVAEGTTVVNYHFPVQIEVMGTLDEAALQAVGDHVFRELSRELDSRQ